MWLMGEWKWWKGEKRKLWLSWGSLNVLCIRCSTSAASNDKKAKAQLHVCHFQHSYSSMQLSRQFFFVLFYFVTVAKHPGFTCCYFLQYSPVGQSLRGLLTFAQLFCVFIHARDTEQTRNISRWFISISNDKQNNLLCAMDSKPTLSSYPSPLPLQKKGTCCPLSPEQDAGSHRSHVCRGNTSYDEKCGP